MDVVCTRVYTSVGTPLVTPLVTLVTPPVTPSPTHGRDKHARAAGKRWFVRPDTMEEVLLLPGTAEVPRPATPRLPKRLFLRLAT